MAKELMDGAAETWAAGAFPLVFLLFFMYWASQNTSK